MRITPDGETWWIQVADLTPGQTYAFQYVVDGAIRIGDPYSDLILDPGNDQWISQDVFPNMHPYPQGKTSGIVSLMQPGAPTYPWQITDFQRPEQSKTGYLRDVDAGLLFPGLQWIDQYAGLF